MEYMDLIKSRFSTRNFSEKSLKKGEILDICEVLQYVPTSRNNQSQRIRVVTEEDDLNKIDKCTPCRYNSGVVIIIGYDKNKSYISNGIETGIIDASIATTYLMQRATDLGFDSVWVGNFDIDKLIKSFNIPMEILPISLLMLGIKNFNCKPSDSHYVRNSLNSYFF